MTVRLTYRFLVLFLFPSLFGLKAQIKESSSPYRSPITQNLKVQAAGDTIGLPLRDDFSRKYGWPSARYWSDNKVWINNSYGVDVPTRGVATFDGLDEYGYAYDIADNSSDTIADVLTSRFFNFTGVPSNLALTFKYQEAGKGEAPASGDFLTVQFWSPIDSSWTEVWRKGATGSRKFRNAFLKVDSSAFLLDGFRFRFAAYGARSGSFDIWNVDYVILDQNRLPADTLFTDPGFTRPHAPLLKDFNALPWFHLDGPQNPFVNAVDLYYRKNGDTQSVSINLRGYTLQRDGQILATKNGIPWNQGSYNREQKVPVPIDPFTITTPTAPFKLSISSVLTGSNDGFRSNDTLRGEHIFDNYYAFDDGSAERVYGISNVSGAASAIRLSPYKSDTIKGIYAYFGQAQVKSSNNSFRIGIWSDLGGQPGNAIYISDSIYRPNYYQTDQFIAWTLDTPGLYLNTSFYIGLIQQTVNPLNIGLDVETKEGDTNTYIFYSDGSNWFQSLFQGRLMLRPYFKYQPVDLSIRNPLLAEKSIKLYPNPARSSFTVEWQDEQDFSLTVYDILGNQIDYVQGSSDAIDIRCDGWKRGIYLIKWQGKKGKILHKKMIID